MTVGEIQRFFEYYAEKVKNDHHNFMVYSAFTAYYGGAYSRDNVKLPRDIYAAFPALFGRTEDGQILAENIEESERAMDRLFKRFNEQKG